MLYTECLRISRRLSRGIHGLTLKLELIRRLLLPDKIYCLIHRFMISSRIAQSWI